MTKGKKSSYTKRYKSIKDSNENEISRLADYRRNSAATINFSDDDNKVITTSNNFKTKKQSQDSQLPNNDDYLPIKSIKG